MYRFQLLYFDRIDVVSEGIDVIRTVRKKSVLFGTIGIFFRK